MLSILPRSTASMLGQTRGFKKHQVEKLGYSAGRSVLVHQGLSASQANYKLRTILQESNFRHLVQSQKRFIPNPVRRRMKRKQRDWQTYLRTMRLRVKQAWDMKTKNEIEKKNYDHI